MIRRRPFLAAASLTGGALAAMFVAARMWDRETPRLDARVASAAGRGAAPLFRPETLGDLPAPVARYFGFALSPGQRRIRTARVAHAGEFRAAPDAAWTPFRSSQRFSADPPGFVWDARIAMVPVAGVRVRDHNLAGQAGMLGRVAGVVPVVDVRESPELASGALHRHLAECVWLPTALLPRSRLRWQAVDDSTARVTLRDADVAVSLDVHFGPSGEIVRVEAERFRDVGGVGVPTPFVGHFRDYVTVEGMRIPRSGEVEWVLPEGRFSYWRGRVVQVEYTYAREG